MSSGSILDSDIAQTPDIQSQILQGTLLEVAKRDSASVSADCCVICLDIVSDPCRAEPCGHSNFDYPCLDSWLVNKPQCPLCKADVRVVLSGDPIGTHRTTFEQPRKSEDVQPQRRRYRDEWRTQSNSREAWRNYNSWQDRRRRPHHAPPRRCANSAPAQREEIYRLGKYSKHVGTNRLSQYRELTPQAFNTNTELVSRAKMFIRRELQVFTHLHSEPESNTCTDRRTTLRMNNAEFLLEYIVAILKSVDIMGSEGQATSMLADFLGLENSRLFLHELRAWLRSPYTKLEDWDRAVQYDDADRAGGSRETRGERPRGDFYRPGKSYTPSHQRGQQGRRRHEPYGSRPGGSC